MEIIWSDMALHQLDGILDYVEEHFGASVSRKTLDDINSKVGRLLLFPESGTPDYSYSSKVSLPVSCAGQSLFASQAESRAVDSLATRVTHCRL